MEPEELVQIIQAENVDQRKLIRLLKETYGESGEKNNFRVEVWATFWMRYALVTFDTY
jgi:hypothetical protein